MKCIGLGIFFTLIFLGLSSVYLSYFQKHSCNVRTWFHSNFNDNNNWIYQKMTNNDLVLTQKQTKSLILPQKRQFFGVSRIWWKWNVLKKIKQKFCDNFMKRKVRIVLYGICKNHFLSNFCQKTIFSSFLKTCFSDNSSKKSFFSALFF